MTVLDIWPCLISFFLCILHCNKPHLENHGNPDADIAIDGGCRNSSIKCNVPWYILLFTKMLWGWKCCCHKRKTWYEYSCCIEDCVFLCSYACAFILLICSAIYPGHIFVQNPWKEIWDQISTRQPCESPVLSWPLSWSHIFFFA